MPQAPTPAPHTPINFVMAGGGMAWSAACVKALAEAGFHPDDFGSHSHVQARCKAARRACDAADGKPVNPPWGSQSGDTVPPPTPTPHQRFLAGSEAGHITQHATQSSSSDRSDACSNRVDGWNASQAPCMPHHGSAREEGTMHCEVTRMEERQPRAGDPPLTRGQDYPPGQMEQHRRERIDAALQHHQDNTLPAGTGQTSGGGAKGTDPTPAQAGFYGDGVDPAAGPPNASKDAKTIDGNSAAECIENFTKQAEAAMKAKLGDSETLANNRAAANGGGPEVGHAQGRQHRENLRAKAEQKAAEHRSAAARQGAATRRLNEAEARYQEACQSGDRDARRAARQERLAARQARNDAFQATQNARQARNDARTESRAADRAWCRYQQGMRIRHGRGRNNPRCPGQNPNLPEHQHWNN